MLNYNITDWAFHWCLFHFASSDFGWEALPFCLIMIFRCFPNIPEDKTGGIMFRPFNLSVKHILIVLDFLLSNPDINIAKFWSTTPRNLLWFERLSYSRVAVASRSVCQNDTLSLTRRTKRGLAGCMVHMQNITPGTSTFIERAMRQWCNHDSLAASSFKTFMFYPNVCFSFFRGWCDKGQREQ